MSLHLPGELLEDEVPRRRLNLLGHQGNGLILVGRRFDLATLQDRQEVVHTQSFGRNSSTIKPWELAGGRAAPGAPVTAVSRAPDELDVFVVGIDGWVWTAAWEPGFTDCWHGWWPAGAQHVDTSSCPARGRLRRSNRPTGRCEATERGDAPVVCRGRPRLS